MGIVMGEAPAEVSGDDSITVRIWPSGAAREAS